MGQIINLDTWEGAPPDALTKTGRGGFLSGGYLGDRPAREVLGDDETAQFVLTNRKQGVSIEGTTTRRVTPDSRFRTVAVVTDRRLVVLVGHDDGDEQFTLDDAAIVGVSTTTGRRSGRLTVETADGPVWHVHTDTNGLEDVAAYLRTAGRAWRAVEGLLEGVERQLETVDRRRRAGEHEQAVSAVRATRDQLDAARSKAAAFGADRSGEALEARVRAVESRCRRTVAAVRLDSARAAVRVARAHCEDGEYEAAQTAYERARDAYDDALTAQGTEPGNVEGVRDERERIDTLVTELRESTLRKAITADREAVAAEDPTVAAGHWQRAITQYEATLQGPTAAEGARFTGDPERIRERIGAVAERLTAIQRTVGNEAMQAGDWYADADQPEAAREAFERAVTALDAALATAREWYPEAVVHLRTEREALAQRIERVEATMNGEQVTDRIETDDEPQYDLRGAVGDIAGPTDIAATIDPPVLPKERPARAAPEAFVRDRETLVEAVRAALEREGWSVRGASPRTPFDLFGSRESELLGVVVADPEGGRIGTDTVGECAVVTGAAGTDTVLLATTRAVDDAAERLAAERGVRLLGPASLAPSVDGTQPSRPSNGGHREAR